MLLHFSSFNLLLFSPSIIIIFFIVSLRLQKFDMTTPPKKNKQTNKQTNKNEVLPIHQLNGNLESQT